MLCKIIFEKEDSIVIKCFQGDVWVRGCCGFGSMVTENSRLPLIKEVIFMVSTKFSPALIHIDVLIDSRVLPRIVFSYRLRNLGFIAWVYKI